jgi:phosphoribosylcarboxyaminoimidazole (NCAIR) mutase
MKTVFSEILSVCAEAGLVHVGDIFLDGTKIKANASLSANRTLDLLDKEIEQMLEEAKAADEEDDKRFGPTRRGD